MIEVKYLQRSFLLRYLLLTHVALLVINAYMFRIALNPNELRSLIQTLEIEYHKHIREQEQTPWILSPPTRGVARTFLSIDEQGYAYPCDFSIGTDFRLSFSLLDKDASLGSIWFSIHLELVRKILIEQDCILASKCP